MSNQLVWKEYDKKIKLINYYNKKYNNMLIFKKKVVKNLCLLGLMGSGKSIIGKESGAEYSVAIFKQEDIDDKYNTGDEFEGLGDDILDFTETNPFGNY